MGQRLPPFHSVILDPGDTVTLTLSGTDAASFEISQTGELTLASTATIDYETDSQYDLIVSAFDGKLTVDQQVVIDVQDLPEPSGEYALSFDGIDDYIQLGDEHNQGIKSRTISKHGLMLNKVHNGKELSVKGLFRLHRIMLDSC